MASGCGSVLDERRRVRLREPGADEDVLDPPAQPLVRAQPAADVPAARGIVSGTRRDGTARPPRRGRPRASRRARARSARRLPVVADLEAEAVRMSCCSSGANSIPMNALARSGRKRTTGRSGSSALDVCLTDQARARRDRRSAGSPDARPARRGRDRRPSPSGSSPAVRSASRSDVRRSPSGSKFAASSRTSVVPSETSLSSPPMIAGERDRALRVGDHRSSRLEAAYDAVERPELLAGPRAAHDDPPAGQLRPCRRRAAGCRDEHHVVRDVDDVRDRAHVRERRGASAASAARARRGRRGSNRPM